MKSSIVYYIFIVFIIFFLIIPPVSSQNSFQDEVYYSVTDFSDSGTFHTDGLQADDQIAFIIDLSGLVNGSSNYPYGDTAVITYKFEITEWSLESDPSIAYISDTTEISAKEIKIFSRVTGGAGNFTYTFDVTSSHTISIMYTHGSIYNHLKWLMKRITAGFLMNSIHLRFGNIHSS